MAESVFGKKQVSDVVKTEITARTGKQGLLWSAKRFPWFRITSLTSLGTIYRFIDSRFIGNLAGNDNYSAVKPDPAVTSINIKKQGELGTTRKATISITCYTDEQLEDLQKALFVPGLGCRVEWGWNKDCSGTPTPGPVGSPLTDPDAKVTAAIRAQCDRSTAYDGLQGIVGNFSYGLTKSNTWECTLEVIAAAEAFSRSSAVVQPVGCSKCAREYKNEDGKEIVEQRSHLYTYFADLFTDFEKAKGAYQGALNTVAGIDENKTTIALYEYAGKDRDENGADDSNAFIDFFADMFGSVDTVEPYISWPTFEAAINLFAIPTSTAGDYTLGRLASPMDTKISYNSWLMSSDPRICLLMGNQRVWTKEIARHYKGDKDDHVAPEPLSISLDHILINVVYLLKVIKDLEKGDSNSMSIHNLVMTVLNKINEVCGDMWDFQLVNRTDVNSSRGPCLAVIDSKTYEADTAFPIPALPMNSVVRDLKLDMKMTEQMKTQALYANGAQQATATVGKGGCGANAFEPFGLNKARSLNMTNRADTPPKCDCDSSSEKAKTELNLYQWFTELQDEVNDSNVSGLKNYLIKTYFQGIKDKTSQHCKGMILPFEFSFTLDGIGGFKFGQMITCDRIPKAVRTRYDWQVTTVEHNITVNDWTTTINTVCRYANR